MAIAYFRSKDSFQRISNQVMKIPIRWSILALHLVALGAFVGLSAITTGDNPLGYLVAALWYAAGVAAIVLAGCAFVPPTLVTRARPEHGLRLGLCPGGGRCRLASYYLFSTVEWSCLESGS